MQNKIVVRYQDGRLTKGFTTDFMPNKDVFHVTPSDALPGAKTVTVNMLELKAVFFVKDFVGNAGYDDKKDFDPKKPVSGRKIKVAFKDGETLVGTTQGYQPGRQGFFVFPADPLSNIERFFVVSLAAKTVSFL